MDQEERTSHYLALKANPLFQELVDFIDMMGKVHGKGATVDLTHLGVGAILAREKALGMKIAFDGMAQYIKLDLPTETETLESLKHEMKQ